MKSIEVFLLIVTGINILICSILIGLEFSNRCRIKRLLVYGGIIAINIMEAMLLSGNVIVGILNIVFSYIGVMLIVLKIK
jgi:hypothetical protein